MSPAELFTLAILITLAAVVWEIGSRNIRHKRLQKLADEWGMNYSPVDQFRLTSRVARDFPVPGAASINVVDLIYGMDGERYWYVFTVEYTAGVVTGKHRVKRAGLLNEPRGRIDEQSRFTVTLGPASRPLLEQYSKLKPACARTTGVWP